jgi:tellurite resistance protein TerC
LNVPEWVWWTTVVATVSILLVDVVIIGRRPHEPAMKEVSRHLAIYIGAAVLFGVGVWIFAGGQSGGEFFAGWLTEYSLSVDNLFIFIIIMSKFAVPRQYQQTALMIGIVLALVMRGIFIAVGAAAIANFSWIFYLFGAFLIYTAIHLAKEGQEDEDEFEENRLIKLVERRFPATSEYHGVKLVVKQNGKRLITPMLLVMLALGTTDLLFALDSIPAIYGLTSEPYLVFTANVFALMGLRQLYFLIGGLLKRLVYLSYGLAFLLAFIGVKLILEALHLNELSFINGGEHVEWAPEIPIWLSLTIIVGTLAVTAVASLLKTRRDSAKSIGEEAGPAEGPQRQGTQGDQQGSQGDRQGAQQGGQRGGQQGQAEDREAEQAGSPHRGPRE